MSTRTRRWLQVLAVVLLALGLRVAYVLGLRASPGFDQPGMDPLYHLEWARAIVAGTDFLRERHHPLGEPSPFFRAPGYIWFLAGVLKLTGGGLLAPRLVQCLLGALSTLLVYLLGRRVLDHRRGLVAAVLAATYWVSIYFDGELLIPTLYVPLNLLGLYLALGLLEGSGRRRIALALGCGVVFGLAAITRPNVLLFLPFLALWTVLRLRRRDPQRSWRAGLVPAALLTLGVSAAIAPVTAYNTFVAGDFALISTQGGVNLWIGNNPQADGMSAIVPGTRAGWWTGYHDSIAQAQELEGRELAPSEVSRHYARRALEFVASQPGDALRLSWHKLELFWNGHEIGNNQPIEFYAHHFSPWTRFLPLRYPELLGLGLLGLLLAVRRGPRVVPLAGFLVLYVASILAFFVCARFRVPVLPILMVFAGHALVWLWERAREGRWERVAVALALVLTSGLASRAALPGLPANDSMGWWHLGVAEGIRGDGEAAEVALRKSLALEPRNVYAKVALGKRLEAKGEWDEALQHLREALILDGRRVDALDPLLRMLVTRAEAGPEGDRAGALSDAETLAERAIQLYPELATPRHWLGRVRVLQERKEEALELYGAAAERDSSAYTLFIDLGRLAVDLGRRRLALEAFERARANLAQARPEEAEEAFRWLLSILAGREQARARVVELAREYAARFPASESAQGVLRELGDG